MHRQSRQPAKQATSVGPFSSLLIVFREASAIKMAEVMEASDRRRAALRAAKTLDDVNSVRLSSLADWINDPTRVR